MESSLPFLAAENNARVRYAILLVHCGAVDALDYYSVWHYLNSQLSNYRVLNAEPDSVWRALPLTLFRYTLLPLKLREARKAQEEIWLYPQESNNKEKYISQSSPTRTERSFLHSCLSLMCSPILLPVRVLHRVMESCFARERHSKTQQCISMACCQRQLPAASNGVKESNNPLSELEVLWSTLPDSGVASTEWHATQIARHLEMALREANTCACDSISHRTTTLSSRLGDRANSDNSLNTQRRYSHVTEDNNRKDTNGPTHIAFQVESAFVHQNQSIERALERFHLLGNYSGVRDTNNVKAHVLEEHLIIVPLYPQYSSITSAIVFDSVMRAKFFTRRSLPHLTFVKSYCAHVAYIDLMEEHLRRYFASHGIPDWLFVVFAGLPREFVRDGDTYQVECVRTYRALRSRLSHHYRSAKTVNNSSNHVSISTRQSTQSTMLLTPTPTTSSSRRTSRLRLSEGQHSQQQQQYEEEEEEEKLEQLEEEEEEQLLEPFVNEEDAKLYKLPFTRHRMTISFLKYGVSESLKPHTEDVMSAVAKYVIVHSSSQQEPELTKTTTPSSITIHANNTNKCANNTNDVSVTNNTFISISPRMSNEETISCSHESVGSYNSILRSVMDSALYLNSINNDMSVNSNDGSSKSKSRETINSDGMDLDNNNNNNNKSNMNTKSFIINSSESLTQFMVNSKENNKVGLLHKTKAYIFCPGLVIDDVKTHWQLTHNLKANWERQGWYDVAIIPPPNYSTWHVAALADIVRSHMC